MSGESSRHHLKEAASLHLDWLKNKNKIEREGDWASGVEEDDLKDAETKSNALGHASWARQKGRVLLRMMHRPFGNRTHTRSGDLLWGGPK